MESQGRQFKKFWKPPSFEDFNITSPSKKIKLDSDDCLEEKLNFIPNEATEPKTISELAIHSKKIEEVRNWMKLSQGQKAPILLVTGPTGSGKTTTVKISADAEGFSIKEWINPVDKTDYKLEPVIQLDCYEKFTFTETCQTDKFEDFVFRSSRYNSIFDKASGTLIIIEDLPNIFVWKPKLFHGFLEKYKSRGKSPIVFIITDDQNLNLNSSLFPNNIKLKFSITNIKFNPVNQSCLVRNLKTLSDFYCPEKVSSQILEKISKNSNGDIRTATNDFLLFLRSNPEGLNQSPKNPKKKIKSNGSRGTCELVSLRDSNFDFYHILGRILYPKLMSDKERTSCENTKRIFLHDVQEIAENLSNSFLGVLHENYLQTLGKFADVVEGAQYFSFCDVLGRHPELEPYSNLVGAIGLMSVNREPRKTGFHPIKKSVCLNLNKISSRRSSSSWDGENELFQDGTSRKDVLLDLLPFLKTLQIDERYRNVSTDLKSGVESSEKVDCGGDGESDEEPIEIEEFED